MLRHFEELTAEETARVIGIERSAASKRYMRALKRLKDAINASPDGGKDCGHEQRTIRRRGL